MAPAVVRSARRRSLLLAIVATVTFLAAVVGRVHGGDPTGPFLIGGQFTRSAAVWPIDVAVVDGPGFDGQFYLALAFDPLLRGPLVETLDDVRYRGRRIVASAAAWLCGAGRPRAILWALLALNCLAIAAGGALVGAWAAEHRATWLWSFVSVCAIGNMVCLERMLVDGIQAALLIATVALAARRTPRALAFAIVAFGLAILQKETAAVAFPLVLVPLLQAKDRRLWGVAAVSAAVVLSWWAYVETRATAHAAGLFAINFDLPGRGWAYALVDALGADKSGLRKLKDLAYLGLHLLAIVVGLRVGGRAWIELLRRQGADGLALAIGLLALLCACLSLNLWREVWGYARTSLPLVSLLLLHSVAEKRESGGRARIGAGELVAAMAALAGVAFAASNLYRDIA